jgi:DNA polymerase-3 subunit delta'
MSLKNLTIGHHDLKESLLRYLRRGPQTNTLLFSGPPGSGKSFFLKAFAQDFLCESSSEFSCGVCASCKSFHMDNPPDFKEYNKEKGLLKIQQVRDLQQDAFLHPVFGRKKLIVLYEADAMTLEAANALLKILEEPNRSTCFILETSKPDKILSTIRSRSILFRFTPYSNEDMKAILESTNQLVDPDLLHLTSSLSNGNVHRAFQLLDKEFFSKRNEYCKKFISLLSEENIIPEFPKKMEKGEMLHFLLEAQSLVEDILSYSFNRSERVKNVDHITRIQEIAEKWDPQRMIKLQDLLLSCEAVVDSSIVQYNKHMLKLLVDCKKVLFERKL